MKETSFIDQNKEKWTRFEKLYASNSHDPEELSNLYMDLTDDLSYAQTFYKRRTVRVYLNQLAQKIFTGVHKQKGESLKKLTGTDFTYAAFTGGALAANAVMGNHVTMVLTNLNEVASMLESGKLRPLAVTTRERLDVLKQVPTVIEQGYKDYEVVAWFALASPAGTPKEIVQKLADDLQAALSDSEVRQKLNTAGLYPAYLGPEALNAHIQQEYQRYSKIIDDARIKLE